MKRILFVDDDPNVLQGLKRLLRPFRREYEMEFVASGSEAMERLSSSTFDVIVSDMRMPGMDGAKLLNQVQQEHPNIARFMLSGQADRDTVMNCVESTHQYLSKPCDAGLLKSTITRACTLRDLLASPDLAKVVSSVQSLPSLPAVYEQVVRELRNPEASLQKVGELIEQDVAMSVKILKLVNSSFFGVGREITTSAQAVSLLGVDVIKSLVLTLGVFSQFNETPIAGFSPEGVMQHSMQVAGLAKKIAVSQTNDVHVHNESYLAGQLHDVGKLVLASSFPREFREALDIVCEGQTLQDAELASLGASHAEIGAYLLGLWGLADEIVEAVAFHHRPSDCREPTFRPLAAVHIANCLCSQGTAACERAVPHELDYPFLESIGLADDVDSFRSMLELELSEATV